VPFRVNFGVISQVGPLPESISLARADEAHLMPSSMTVEFTTNTPHLAIWNRTMTFETLLVDFAHGRTPVTVNGA
jgi:hypothetical protein